MKVSQRIQLKGQAATLVLRGCNFDSRNFRGILRKIHYVINHAGLTERVLFNHPVWFRMPGHHVFFKSVVVLQRTDSHDIGDLH